jgi:Na+/H+-dicarboxylate symporter
VSVSWGLVDSLISLVSPDPLIQALTYGSVLAVAVFALYVAVALSRRGRGGGQYSVIAEVINEITEY